jgi:hypothetical protein
MEPGNQLNISTLSEGWSDKDMVILHACFQILTDCIEKEQLFTGHIDWANDELHINAKKEILELYEWWKERVQKEQDDEIDPIWTEKQHYQDTEMLIRLIKIRGFLWT